MKRDRLPAWYFEISGWMKVRASTEQEAARIADAAMEGLPCPSGAVGARFETFGPLHLVDRATGRRLDG